VRLEQVQPTIPNDGALIEYLRYPHYLGKNQREPRYGAIVLFSKSAPIWIPLGKANEIEALVRRYGTLVRGSPEEDELSANLKGSLRHFGRQLARRCQVRQKGSSSARMDS
jgi:hypothetical protein